MSYEQIAKILNSKNIKLASINKRALAFLIDEFILGTLFIIIYWDAFSVATSYEQKVLLVSNLFTQFMALKIIYYTFFTWYYGASVGKIIFKITCVDIFSLKKPNFIASLSRAGVKAFGDLSFYIGFIWAFGNVARQTWQDRVSKTVVIDVA